MALVVTEGMEIKRGLIDPSIAGDFQDEMLGFLSCLRRGSLFGEFEAEHLRPKAFTLEIDDIWEASGFTATKAIAKILNLNIDADTGFNPFANYQPARLAQDFHRDNPVVNDKVIIVHGGDNGAFDFSLGAQTVEEAEANHQTIELSAGDVVYQSMPYILHRGRNTGDTPRVTAVFAQVVSKYDFV